MGEIYTKKIVRNRYVILVTAQDDAAAWGWLDTCEDEVPGVWQTIETFVKDQKTGREAYRLFDVAYSEGDSCLECQPAESWQGSDADYFEAISGLLFVDIFNAVHEIAAALKPSAKYALTEATECTA